MNIPDEMLPELYRIQGEEIPKLPPMKHFNKISSAAPEEKARRYLEEACGALALFKYWASKAE